MRFTSRLDSEIVRAKLSEMGLLPKNCVCATIHLEEGSSVVIEAAYLPEAMVADFVSAFEGM